MLIGMRVEMMLNCFGINVCKKLVDTCKSHVRSFIERYQMTESMRQLSRHQIMTSNIYHNNNMTINQTIFQSHTNISANSA